MSGEVSAGGNHTVSLRSDGTLWAVGYNAYGQLGDWTFTDRQIPQYITTAMAADTTPPETTPSVNGGIYESSQSVVLTCSDDDGAACVNIYYTTDGSIPSESSNVYSAPITISSTSTLKFFAKDAQGNSEDVKSAAYTIGKVIQIAAGGYHTAVVKNDGTLWGWGRNDYGQVGDGTTVERTSPVLTDTGTSWSLVDAGRFHTVAIKNNGTLWAWGRNADGQLGDGTTVDKTSPVQIGSDADWSHIAAGDSHTVAIKSNGTLWAWGRNNYGQLGDGTTDGKISPVQIGTAADWSHIAAGDSHTIAIKSNGTLWAWGLNNYGQLGDGTTLDRSAPVQIGTDADWTHIAAGDSHTVAIKSNGTLWGWGNGNNGQIGESYGTWSPAQIGTDTNWSQISTGDSFTVAIKSDGTQWAVGNHNYYGVGNYSVPVQIESVNYWSRISAGANHIIALNNDGTLWAWRNNDYGQLGDGTWTDRTEPAQIWRGKTDAVIAAGQLRSAAITSDGTLWQWGYSSGHTPSQITLDTVWSKVSVGWSGVLAIKNNGTLWQWENYSGIGYSQIGTDAGWSQVSAAGSHILAIKNDGTLWAWGENNDGQLGDGTSLDRWSPVQIGTDNDWSHISAGQFHSVAIKRDGTLWAWGNNAANQLGDGTIINSYAPLQIGTGTNWSQVSAGSGHTVALKSDGTIWAWGSDQFGQLGDSFYSCQGSTDNTCNSNANKVAPFQIGSDTNWSHIWAGDHHTMAIKKDGTLWAFGYNAYGQLGDGTTQAKTEPVQIGTDTSWSQVSAGPEHTLALKSDGTTWAWGGNGHGSLGDGTGTVQLTPVQVPIFPDSTSPTGTVSINNGLSYTNDSSVSLTGICSDVSACSRMKFSNDNNTWSTAESASFSVGKSWTLTDGEGTKTVYVKFKDEAGNWSDSFSDDILLDTTAPATTASLPGGIYNGAQTVTLTCTDGAGSGCDNIIYTWAAAFSEVYTGPITITESTSLHFYAKDLAGNYEETKTVVYTIDTTPPTGAVSVDNDAGFTNSTTASLTISCTDENGCSEMQFSNDNTTWSTTEPYATSKTWVLNSGDGTKTVYVKFKDVAGNWSDVFSDDIVIETAPPATTSSPGGGIYNTAQGMSLTCSDGIGSGCDKIYYTTDGTTPTTLSTVYTIPISITATTTLKFFAVDLAGNSETVKTQTYTIDTTAPTGSISINSGAASANSITATLTLTCTDTNGCSQMQFSNDNSTWSTAETYATSKTWTLATGDGTKTVYVKFKDVAGNWSTSYSDTIALDITSPATAASPAGGTYSTTQSVTLTCSDGTGAGCDKIYYTTDGTTPTTASTVYSTAISISATKTLKYFGTDLAGNSEVVNSEAYTIDTDLPTLTISTLSNGAVTNTETLNISGTVTDNTGVQGLTVNGVAVTVNTDGTFSHALVLNQGANIITTVATDLAGNQTTDTRTITLDTAAPALVIDTPADNSNTAASIATVTGTIDETSTVTVTLNGGTPQYAAITGNTFTQDILLASGVNTIEVTAIDMAGNTSTLKRTVTYDSSKPSLEVTEPNQDIRTNQNSIIIKGIVSDALTAVSVSVTVDGNTYTPNLTNGQFEQVVTFTTEKTYTITVIANDEAGNETTVQRNVIYDTTQPTIDFTVATPTINTSQAITGTMEEGSTITVTSPSATVGAVTYSTATTWSANVTGMIEGLNTVTVTATDAAGNEATFAKEIVVDTVAPITAASPVGGTYNLEQSVVLTCTDGPGSGCDKIYYTTNGTTPTTASTVYSAAISITATKTLKYFAKDLAGNSETVKTQTYTIDATVPAFSSISPASGSYINTVTAGYSLSEAVSSGKITFTRTGGKADSTSHVYNFTSSDITAGSHFINTGLALVDKAIYTVIFEATDSAGNTGTVTSANVTYDTTTTSVTIDSPASNSVTNNAKVSYTLSEDISAGNIVFTWTSGMADGMSPYTYPLSSLEMTKGTHTVDTVNVLMDGAIYTISFENVMDMAGNATATVSNTSVIYDATAVAITNTSPASNNIITNATVTYSLSEQASSGKITFTWSGGTADPSSPHVYTFKQSDMTAGPHTLNTNLGLADGAFYTMSFDAADLVGNAATTVSTAMIFYDSQYGTGPTGNVDNSSYSNNRVDGFDLIKLSIAFGSSAGDANWNPVCDLDGDGIIDGNDLMTLGIHFGEVQ